MRLDKPKLRHELIQSAVDNYMDALLDNPETVRAALECYFETFNNDEIEQILKGFDYV